jgi:hypothetical protein
MDMITGRKIVDVLVAWDPSFDSNYVFPIDAGLDQRNSHDIMVSSNQKNRYGSNGNGVFCSHGYDTHARTPGSHNRDNRKHRLGPLPFAGNRVGQVLLASIKK